jgi:DNA-binding GntR family transcriptional regulator
VPTKSAWNAEGRTETFIPSYASLLKRNILKQRIGEYDETTYEKVHMIFAAKRPIQRNISTPLWLQLKHALRDMITFDVRPGDKIPTEAQICEAYSLSRVTVRLAITALVDEGLLERRQGRGTYVPSGRLAEPLSEKKHFLLSGFDEALLSDISVYSAETVKAPEWICSKLDLSFHSAVFKIRKVLSVRGEVVAFRTSYVPIKISPDLLNLDLQQPLVTTLETRFGLKLTSADETIEFIVADDFRCQMLGVAINHPLILVEHIIKEERGLVVACSRTYYKADRFRFYRQVNRENVAS